jgi:hypothetical protein
MLARQALSHTCFGYFCDRAHFMPRPGLEHDPPIYTSCVAGTAGALPSFLMVEMGSRVLFA